MKKHIPNAITCCNLISGCIATFYAFQQDFRLAFLFIIVGAVFDFFDGFTARLLHVSSPIGKELDSLADDVTFGFAPAAAVYSMLAMALGRTACPVLQSAPAALVTYLPYVAFLIAAFSALRLAKFNLDERQTSSFIGLPTPANALFWSALAYSLQETEVFAEAWFPVVVTLGIFLSCWLLVAEIPMFALKFKTFAFRPNMLRYGFILFSLVMLGLLGFGGFSAIIVCYVICSLVNNKWGNS